MSYCILCACTPIMTTFLLDGSGRSARTIAMNDVGGARGAVRALVHVVVATRARRAEPVWSGLRPSRPRQRPLCKLARA